MTTILCNRGDENQTIEEAKQEWLQEVLLALDVPEDLFKEQVDDVRQILDNYKLDIWKNANGTIDIYRENKLIGQWLSPKLILVHEKKEWYYRIETQHWALPFQLRKKNV